jgi:hypothetical protein
MLVYPFGEDLLHLFLLLLLVCPLFLDIINQLAVWPAPSSCYICFLFFNIRNRYTEIMDSISRNREEGLQFDFRLVRWVCLA